MGEDAGFKFLAAMNKNVNQYTRSGSAGIRAAAKGETTIGITFLHDSVAQTVQGYPIKTIAPCEGTGYEIISSSIIKNGPNPEGAKEVDGLHPVAGGTERRVDGRQVPDPVEQECVGASDTGAEAVRGEAHQARPRQVRVEGRPRIPAEALGERGFQGAQVVAARPPAGARPAASLAMTRRRFGFWLAVGWAGFLVLP
jgi:hypothetical protein